MDQPLAQPEHVPYEPTVEDLRDIADFIRQRSLQEAEQAGMMRSNRNHGVTIRVTIPKDMGPDARTHVRQSVTSWLDEHSPDRFMDMAGKMAWLAYTLASETEDNVYACQSQPHVLRAHRVHSSWRALTSAARLWEKHPDFKQLWGQDEQA